jgi:hypothetical protein
MRRTLFFVISASFLAIQVGNADTLHGFCVSPTPTCSDNGTVTPTGTNPPNFGFNSSGTTMGDFELLLLAPNNEVSSPSTFSLTIAGTNVATASAASSLVNTTAFTGGKLESVLGLSYTPSNPLSAWLPSTESIDTGATGYFVYTFWFGAETGNPKDQATAPTFKITSGSLPLGSIFAGLQFATGSTTSVIGSTPPSAAIFVSGKGPSPPPPSVPEPTSAGLLLTGLAASVCVIRKRRKIFPKP